MDIKEIIFWSLSTIAFICAIYTVLAKNPIFSAISLLVCFACIAGHYLLLNAQFLFIVHIIVYAGAIMVLFLTTVMLMNLNEETENHKPAIAQIAALVVAVVLGIVLMAAVRKANVLIDLGRVTSADQPIDVPVTASGNASLWLGEDGVNDEPDSHP